MKKSSCLKPQGFGMKHHIVKLVNIGLCKTCMKHHLVNLYQVCSNSIPGAKNGPLRGSHLLHRPICDPLGGPFFGPRDII